MAKVTVKTLPPAMKKSLTKVMGRPPKFPWDTMAVGSYFEVPEERRSSVLGNGQRYAEKHQTGAKYISRKTDKGTVMIIRVE